MKKDIDKTLYCAECGSTNVDIKMWVNPNTGMISGTCSDLDEEDDNWCNNCENHVQLLTLKELWERFSEVNVNTNDEIEEDFLSFPAGTDKMEVWHWFDERCPNNLHDDLMFS